MKVSDDNPYAQLISEGKEDSSSVLLDESEISEIEDPNERKILRLKKRKRQIEVILRIILGIGALFSVGVSTALSVIANKIQGFPWNGSLGNVVRIAWCQICYYFFLFFYQQFQTKGLYICFLVLSIGNIGILCFSDIFVLNDIIKYYRNELPDDEVNAVEEMGAPTFGGIIFYLLFVGVVLAVVVRHFGIKHMKI